MPPWPLAFFSHAALLDLLSEVLDLLSDGEEKHERGDGGAGKC
jgi:hypothetical protein